MKKSYLTLGFIGVIAGYILSDIIGDAAQGLIIVSGAMVAYGIFYRDTKVKTGRPSSPLPEAVSPPPPPQEENVYYCKECGKPLTYIERYKRWYCYNCEKYA